MGCDSCSNNSSGLPNGCKNNGACGVSGCDKLEVFDWLAGMELPENQKPYDIIEVRFKNGRKLFYRNVENIELHIGEVIAVEASPGHDIGVVSLTGELVRIQLQKKGFKDNHELRKVYRKAGSEDIERWQEASKLEKETMSKAREIARSCGLDMKISDVEYQGDNSKCTFFYTAEDRVDFRDLIRKLAEAFKVRIEMRQIGMRQEAGRLGGIGSCGRELCCSTWLTDFRSVSTSAARYQQLSLNPQKLAGQCGKLKCCLNFELDQYVEAVKMFPPIHTKLQTIKGVAVHFKTDIFKKVMYFVYQGEYGTSPMPIGLDDVLEIIEMNKRDEKPQSLEDFTIDLNPIEVEEVFANVVGQDSLTRFDRSKSANRKRSSSKRKPGGNNPGRQRPEAKKAEEERKEGGRPKQKRKPNRTRPQNDGQPKTQNQASGDKPASTSGEGKPKPANRRPKGKRGGKPPGNTPKPESPS
ncbi:MAG: cell fate regulator YaaT (PSP1 superfamily) [Flavobacteriales bacterium]|jgi:cell fate regulator YaaT (PSP1 superfamily)